MSNVLISSSCDSHMQNHLHTHALYLKLVKPMTDFLISGQWRVPHELWWHGLSSCCLGVCCEERPSLRWWGMVSTSGPQEQPGRRRFCAPGMLESPLCQILLKDFQYRRSVSVETTRKWSRVFLVMRCHCLRNCVARSRLSGLHAVGLRAVTGQNGLC